MIDRTIHITPLNDESLSLSGYVYDYQERECLGFLEHIPRETFEAALVGNPLIALRFDFTSDAIAYTSDGSLLLNCFESGLHVNAIVEARHRNALQDCDFALSFKATDDEWTHEGERNHRLITELVLCDIGVIAKPKDET